jgi:hypothetical protein
MGEGQMDRRQGVSAVFDNEEVDSLLSGQFYTSSPAAHGARVGAPAVYGAQVDLADETPRRPKLLTTGAEKPSHYKVICISLYTEDLDNLDRMVEALKARGLTKASRSALIRYALGAVDLDKVPRGL